jgi:hypothetical protein
MRPITDISSHYHQLRVLRRMTPNQRLVAALELSELTRALFAAGLRRGYPHLSDADLDALFRTRLDLCHSSRS